MRAQVAAAIAMVVASGFVAAQKEMPSLRIVVAPIRHDAIECGIDETSIESAAGTALRGSGIRTAAGSNAANVDSDNHPLLVISPNVLRPPGRCVVNLLVEVKETTAFEQEHASFTPKTGSTWTVLCSSATLMTVPTERASQHFHRSVESNVKECLRQLDY